MLLSFCSCSRQLAVCLHTSQREIDWGRVPVVVWMKLASVVMKMLRKKNSLSAFIWIEVHTGRRLWGTFGLWELEKKSAFMFVWDGGLTAHLQSQSYVLAFSQAVFLPEDPGSDFYPLISDVQPNTILVLSQMKTQVCISPAKLDMRGSHSLFHGHRLKSSCAMILQWSTSVFLGRCSHGCKKIEGVTITQEVHVYR